VLKELIPLVSHFSQMKHELQAWLCDVAADVEALDSTPGDITPDTDDHAEQLRMRRYNVKVPVWFAASCSLLFVCYVLETCI